MLDERIKTAIQALVAGSVHILNLFGRDFSEINPIYKPGQGDTPRTLIDTNAEEAILRHIRAHFPDDAINAEESGESGIAKIIWHIDPYDGTSNAQIKLGMSTTGIGISVEGRLVASIIVHPFERKIFYAEKGNGAYVETFSITDHKGLSEINRNYDPKRIYTDTISDTAKDRYAWVDSLVNSKTTPRINQWIARMVEEGFFQNLRSTGSNIDYSTKLAEGRAHYQLTHAVGGFFDLCGYVLIEEAGGRMVNIYGKEPKPGDKVAIAVANPRDLESVLKITQEAYSGYGGFA